MTNGSGIRSTHVVAGAVLGLAGVAINLILIADSLGTNPGYLTLVWLIPSIVAASGLLMTQGRTLAFHLAVGCCVLVCLGSLITITVACTEWLAPISEFALAGAVIVGWCVQLIPAGLSGVIGVGAWLTRCSRITRGVD